MSVRFKKIHPALKHAGYSATALLPGEDRAAFEKLHRALIAEFTPLGALEEDIVADLARLLWRKQNLATFRIAQLADARRGQIKDETVPAWNFAFPVISMPTKRKKHAGPQMSKLGKNSGTFIN
jgi:hypothetical protein